MASKRRIRRNSCTGKQRHDTQTEAVKHCISYLRRCGGLMHTYKCRFCGAWHVGH